MGERHRCCSWWVWEQPPFWCGWVIPAPCVLVAGAAPGVVVLKRPLLLLSYESCFKQDLTLPGLLCSGCHHVWSHLRRIRREWVLHSPSALQLLPHKWWPLGQFWSVLHPAANLGCGKWFLLVYFYCPTASCSLPRLRDDLSQMPGELWWPGGFITWSTS